MSLKREKREKHAVRQLGARLWRLGIHGRLGVVQFNGLFGVNPSGWIRGRGGEDLWSEWKVVMGVALHSS